MGNRSEALAARIEQGAGGLAAFAATITDEEWGKPVSSTDQRTVGVIVHHVADVYPIEVDLAEKLAAGEKIEGVTWAAIAEMNAGHASTNAAVSKAEALEHLAASSKRAAERVRAFADDSLDNAAEVSLYGDPPLTAQFFLEDHAVRHSWHHLAKIRAALGR